MGTRIQLNHVTFPIPISEVDCHEEAAKGDACNRESIIGQVNLLADGGQYPPDAAVIYGE